VVQKIAFELITHVYDALYMPTTVAHNHTVATWSLMNTIRPTNAATLLCARSSLKNGLILITPYSVNKDEPIGGGVLGIQAELLYAVLGQVIVRLVEVERKPVPAFQRYE
jgi:hypothetical protein